VASSGSDDDSTSKSDIRVLKFDTDEQPDLAELFQIGGLPTLLFLVAGDNGQPKVRAASALYLIFFMHAWLCARSLAWLNSFFFFFFGLLRDNSFL